MDKPPYPWQQKQWQTCLHGIAEQTLPHAILLYGENGLGINQFAEQLVSAILCRDPKPHPCGVCNACRLRISGNHPDYLSIMPADDKADIKINDIREAIHFLQVASHYECGKVLLIRQADAMNRSAANSLLKTLEEPPPDSTIILTSHWLSKLLPTIRSRCQTLRFACPDTDMTAQWLATQTQLDKETVEARLATLSTKPLVAYEMLQAQTDEAESKATFYEDLQTILSGGSIIAIAEKWMKLPQQETQQWLLEIADTTIQQSMRNTVSAEKLKKQYRFYDRQVKRYQSRMGNLNPQLLLEVALLEWKIVAQLR